MGAGLTGGIVASGIDRLCRLGETAVLPEWAALPPILEGEAVDAGPR